MKLATYDKDPARRMYAARALGSVNPKLAAEELLANAQRDHKGKDSTINQLTALGYIRDETAWKGLVAMLLGRGVERGDPEDGRAVARAPDGAALRARPGEVGDLVREGEGRRAVPPPRRPLRPREEPPRGGREAAVRPDRDHRAVGRGGAALARAPAALGGLLGRQRQGHGRRRQLHARVHGPRAARVPRRGLRRDHGQVPRDDPPRVRVPRRDAVLRRQLPRHAAAATTRGSSRT